MTKNFSIMVMLVLINKLFEIKLLSSFNLTTLKKIREVLSWNFKLGFKLIFFESFKFSFLQQWFWVKFCYLNLVEFSFWFMTTKLTLIVLCIVLLESYS